MSEVRQKRCPVSLAFCPLRGQEDEEEAAKETEERSVKNNGVLEGKFEKC